MMNVVYALVLAGYNPSRRAGRHHTVRRPAMKREVLLIAMTAALAVAVSSPSGHAQQDGAHAPSGGTQSTLQSINVPPWPDAPFTAVVSTTWVRNLDGGGTFTIQNRRTIARDSVGRIFEERRWLYPAGDPNENMLRRTEISDPRTGTIYFCLPQERKCELRTYYFAVSPAPVRPAGPIQGGKAFLTRELLGKDSVSGVEVVGTRETITYNAGAFGNDKATSVVKEFWYSPQLGINVIE